MWRDSGTWIALGVSLLFIVAGIVMHRVFIHILKNGAPAVEAYKNFLRSGCTQDPVSLLKIAGVNLEDE